MKNQDSWHFYIKTLTLGRTMDIKKNFKVINEILDENNKIIIKGKKQNQLLLQIVREYPSKFKNVNAEKI